ncbi:DUF1366 domain-containing protein [Streptococcus suis]|uniref:Protein of uncharacterized function (DUF1366) n=1 Tax=Streptococcus suis TaxID=1307 RepID=A0A0Z8FKQ0_STRSU|nr:DUF1366 domain-containing protein [Streptococcus suis]QBX21531.1 hypothetical protein Javan577_0046 [Streptococcus phage Javan577]NQH27076.1 DUF1366 domain-containing protein [Streptococcus suis]NQH48534.1 DUF1366 domain-containing protein [Streptococcus suis]NQP42202.1 DUF1366 domain-containing protein [Streptococcus suis]CYU66418.1 Protein of uncharacterised function (DUF1366) [Streptococcus suis]
MKFKFLTKSTEWLGSSPHRTIVVVGNEEGATIPYAFDKEAINLTDSELFDMAMEKMYQENFPNRAEDEKFNEIGKRLAKVDDITEEATKNLEKVKEQVKLSAASRSSFLKITVLLYEKGILTDEELFATGIFDDESEDSPETDI